ncbi:hypothetical protein Poly30_51970 [Planctomycetes bacterium Poly30]|uniref:Arylsulfotransferase (ASST) n=1 Tax=Saltatorellus ferox TaxID=2528018 RepID=A0A518EZY7_9BACT|nr:hypothetical protein Poly30_51970 [Planctomycetes bacterium Poly30]
MAPIALPITLLVALLGVQVAGCNGRKAESEPTGKNRPGAYAVRSDGRGWAVSDDGLFGHRRGAGAPSAPLGKGLGYAQGSEAAPTNTGILVRKPDRMAPGLNLMHSGDAAEAVLMDSTGKVEHRWALAYEKLPEAPPLATSFQIPWRRVHLRSDGSLLAMHSDAALVSIDRRSRLQWVLYDRVHHDLDVVETDAGPMIYALARRERVVPPVNPDEPVVDDLILLIDATGKKTRTVSLWDAFIASEWAPLLTRLNVRVGDVMHANSLDVLDEKEAAAFESEEVKAGDVLVCMRDLDIVGVIDVDAEKLVWMTQGPSPSIWRGAHDPSITASGEMLIFDNLGGVGGHSRLLALEPGAKRANWTWSGTPAESFSSVFCGTAHELPGGNILVAESCHGRAIEIDRATGDIVWEFVSDRLAGEEDELVAALFEIERIPRPDWLASD